MGGVYSKRLAGPSIPGSSEVVAYTVPAGKVAIVRTVTLCNTTGTAQIGRVGVGAGVTSSFIRESVPAVTTLTYDVRVPMVAGEQLVIASATTGPVITVGGYELDA
jgi:hypothetical protein